jgi:predicted alpha-1,6-mannanase (GH76 family)
VDDSAGERELRAVARLLRFYRPRAGRFWPARGAAWQLALVIEAVATAYEHGGQDGHARALNRWLGRHRARRSRFFDDDLWYVNAWLRCFDVTGDPAFLTAAQAGFAAVLPGWDDTCGGGMWWGHERTYKNAITNELFLLAASRLARRAPGDYLDWARRAWAWFDHSGLINVDGLVNDGLAGCVNNGATTWTYNQGVLVSGLAELCLATGDVGLLTPAYRVADAAIAHLAPGGILREPSEPDSDADQLIFKGVLAQGLARLGEGYRGFLRANAESVWERARTPGDAIGLCWAGPPIAVTGASHASGTLLLGAVAGLER